MYSEGSITAVVASEEDYPLNDDWACDMHSESMAAFVETRISTSDILSGNSYVLDLIKNLTTRALLLPMIDGFAFSLNNDEDILISNEELVLFFTNITTSIKSNPALTNIYFVYTSLPSSPNTLHTNQPLSSWSPLLQLFDFAIVQSIDPNENECIASGLTPVPTLLENMEMWTNSLSNGGAEVDARKLILSITWRGRDFTCNETMSSSGRPCSLFQPNCANSSIPICYSDAVSIMTEHSIPYFEREMITNSSYFTYSSNNISHQVFLDDPLSNILRYEAARIAWWRGVIVDTPECVNQSGGDSSILMWSALDSYLPMQCQGGCFNGEENRLYNNNNNNQNNYKNVPAYSYGNPSSNSCYGDGNESAVQVAGVGGVFCSPPCFGKNLMECPQNYAPGVQPGIGTSGQCILYVYNDPNPNPTKPIYCALTCNPNSTSQDGLCGGGATCIPNQGIGICAFPPGP
jgi:hypothetical protein